MSRQMLGNKEQHSLGLSFSRLLRLTIVVILSTISISSAQDQNQNITEQILYTPITQGDKSFKFFTMQVTNRYFVGSQSLAFKVVSETYDSDPDIFISKINQQPRSAVDSQWYCMKAGSDTCIVKRSDINYGDFFYVGIRCMNPCTYSLRAVYAPVTSLAEATRTQVRFDGYSSNIFEYYIPSDAQSGIALGTKIMIESESAYSSIDMYFSIDDDLYQIEEKKQGQIIQNGKAYFFNSDDYDWCTRCYVYILIDVIDAGRYYITGTATARNEVLTTTTSSQRIINARSQECYQYFVQKQDNDLQVQINQYQGDAEAYFSPRNIPTGVSDSANIKLFSERYPQRSMIATSKDRARYGYTTGLYYICLYGQTDTSAQITVSETNYNYRYDAVDDMLYTVRLENPGYVYFRYTTQDFTLRTNINLNLTAFNLTSGTEPPKIFYKVCSSSSASDCYLEVTEAQGKLNTQEVGTYNGTTRNGTIYHDPSVCNNVNSCYYLISVYYVQTVAPLKISFKIAHDNGDPTDAQLDTQYRNIKKQGSYEFYELLPGSSDGYPYTESVIINLRSFMGDGEIYVSTINRFPTTSNYTYRSVEFGDTLDRVILNKTTYFSLNKPIYISIFAYTQVAYELGISAVYSPTYNAQLDKATPLTDSVPYFQSYANEYQESFFSFSPWWPGSENRTMVFVGDVFLNNIFFYMQRNDYPMFFLTDWKDSNDVVALNQGDNGYDRKSQYYIRVRPDFALYDLISTKLYIFNFFAFSQLPSNQWQDLQHNEKQMGYANNTSQFYRFIMLNKTSTYVITVSPLQGNPRLLIKMSNSPIFTNSSNIYTYDYKSDNPGKSVEQLNITMDQRSRNSADCDKAGYSVLGGQKLCNFYIGIECPLQCVYNITIQVQGKENEATTFQPPRYLTEHKFQTGTVKYSQIKYYYYPIHVNNTGDMALLLNKTGPLQTNGDVMILVNIQNETSNLPYESWKYPTLSSAHMASYTNSSTQPELIEICAKTFAGRCANTTCTLIIGVLGVSQNKTSQFRITAFKRETRLVDKVPVSSTIDVAGKYHYYWFVNNITVARPNATWDYIVAASTFNKSQDVDLYVSAMDGRSPTTDDNDWFSDNTGPDDLHLTNADSMFAMKNWNTSNGILFIVGVKALTDNTTYSLMMSGPDKYSMQFFDLNTSVVQTKSFLNTTLSTNNTHIFKWFNWGHRDFRFQVDATVGQVYVFFNYMDEETYTNNGFLAVPLNQNNSRYSIQVNASDSNQLKVYKTDIDTGFFCYYCWYYVTIFSNNTNFNSSYKIQVTEIADAGDDIPLINIGDPNSLQLPATGSVAQRKFLLDTKNPFTISVTLATGYAIVYVGLYPDAPLSKLAWKSEGGIGTLTMRVRTTDPNFHIGTYYYVTMQSTQGRATISLKVSQSKEIYQLDNRVSKKDLFWTVEERVKLYFFKVPIGNFTVKVNIDALTEDFYPTVYLQKNNLTSQPADFRTLQYPNVRNYTAILGDNFSQLANQQKIQYVFRDSAVTNFTYYTLALYDYSYGMTDRRKAEFRISLEITNQTNIANGVIVSETAEALHFEETESLQAGEETLYEKINSWFGSTYTYYNNMINEAINSFNQS